MAGEGEFGDGKDAGALRTIGELCEALGLKAHVLRYWEDQFPQLKPLKRSGGRRYYRPDDVALVREIDRLVNRQGYTLRGARAALKEFDPSSAAIAAVPANPSADAPLGAPEKVSSQSPAPETIGKLRAIRARLAEALAG
jgi:DNA-binding transcriptional MerR regulator